MTRLILVFAATSGLISVALGAFAAHGLRNRLPENLLHAFETGVQYQFLHSLALLFCGLALLQFEKHWTLTFASYGFMAGILLFSGSLYLLALTGMKWLGPITPLGGVCFIVGWAFLVAGAWQLTK